MTLDPGSGSSIVDIGNSRCPLNLSVLLHGCADDGQLQGGFRSTRSRLWPLHFACRTADCSSSGGSTSLSDRRHHFLSSRN